MTYHVSVTVTKEFESEKDAEAFASKVIEPIKGVNYTKEIRYYKPKNVFNSVGPYTVTNYSTTVNNPITDEDVDVVSNRIHAAARMGLLKEGNYDD